MPGIRVKNRKSFLIQRLLPFVNVFNSIFLEHARDREACLFFDLTDMSFRNIIARMSDICILYTLFDRDRTVYSVRKEICEIFGLYAIPSHGTIYPALKKLHSSGYLEMNDFMSEGGRKSCYFKITDKGKKYFSKLMLSDFSENPGVFMTDLKLRICASDVLSKEKKSEFVEKSLRLLELYAADVQKFLNDKYKNPSNSQREMYELTLNEISLTVSLLKGLK